LPFFSPEERSVVIRKDYTIFETTGQREETDTLIKVLEQFSLIEFVRSARVAIIKDSKGFHEKLKEFEQAEPQTKTIEEIVKDNDVITKLV